MADLYDKVVQKEKDMQRLFLRMDDDKDMLYLKRFIMRDLEGKVVPNIINVTLNDPAVFAANVISSLGNSTEQAEVVTDNHKIDTDYIEDFIKSAFDANGRQLALEGRPQLNPFLDEQTCIRGRCAARCCFREEDGVIIPDITPWDTRYVTYEAGVNGLEWAAYRTMRPAGRVLSEYPDAPINPLAKQNVEVCDIWSPETNEIWVGGNYYTSQPNPWGYVPVVIQTVTLGSMLADDDALEHHGESIFFLIRGLMPEMNRLASIAQTINFKTTSGAQQYVNKEGGQATPPKHEDVNAPGSMTSVDLGGGIQNIPIQDVIRAFSQLHAIIETRIQRGSLSSIDLGTLQFQLSAVALIQIGEGRDQVFLPRLGARGLLKQRLAEMIIDQCSKIGGTIELGASGHKKKYDTGKLKGDYDIEYRYFVKSPQVDIARYSVAASAGNLISDKTKRRDILQLQDPDGEEKKLSWEMAAMLSPAVRMNRIILALAESDNESDQFEAELMAAEMGVSLQRLLAGDTTQLPTPQKEKAPEIVPLMGKGGEPTSAQKAANLQKQPTEMQGGE